MTTERERLKQELRLDAEYCRRMLAAGKDRRFHLGRLAQIERVEVLLRSAEPVKGNVGGIGGVVMRFLDEINPMIPATHEEASHD